MRKFKYQDQDAEYIITEEEIINEYYDYWCKQIFRVHKSPMITIENCIEDFLIIHWAYEIT